MRLTPRKILAVVACCTLIIPAHYLAKLVYGSCGLLFWHVIPVLAALPPGARARFVFNIYLHHILLSGEIDCPVRWLMPPPMPTML